MKIETLKSLTEDELALLLTLANSCSPRILPYEMKPSDLCFICDRKFKDILNKAKENLNEEGKPIFDGLSSKLGLI